jgi:hypothetical protein
MQLIHGMSELKFGVSRWLILHTNMGVAWLWAASYAVTLAAGSSALIVWLAPAAVGSGIPEVMAYLNGVMMPKVCKALTPGDAPVWLVARRGNGATGWQWQRVVVGCCQCGGAQHTTLLVRRPWTRTLGGCCARGGWGGPKP